MKISSLTLYLEINNSKFIFLLESEENNISKIIYESNTPLMVYKIIEYLI